MHVHLNCFIIHIVKKCRDSCLIILFSTIDPLCPMWFSILLSLSQYQRDIIHAINNLTDCLPNGCFPFPLSGCLLASPLLLSFSITLPLGIILALASWHCPGTSFLALPFLSLAWHCPPQYSCHLVLPLPLSIGVTLALASWHYPPSCDFSIGTTLALVSEPMPLGITPPPAITPDWHYPPRCSYFWLPTSAPSFS